MTTPIWSVPRTNGPVKHSLFNVFKMLRPVVVLDEAHKAYGAKKRESNEEVCALRQPPRSALVIELSATPNRGISNLLVDISGVELKAEEMIKLPVQVKSFPGAEWQYTLAQAHEELERLECRSTAPADERGTLYPPHRGGARGAHRP